MGSRKKAVQIVSAIESSEAFSTAVEESEKYLAGACKGCWNGRSPTLVPFRKTTERGVLHFRCASARVLGACCPQYKCKHTVCKSRCAGCGGATGSGRGRHRCSAAAVAATPHHPLTLVSLPHPSSSPPCPLPIVSHAVFDVHQSWCGPCSVMEPILRKIKLDNEKINVKFFTVSCLST